LKMHACGMCVDTLPATKSGHPHRRQLTLTGDGGERGWETDGEREKMYD
jgi:hypothetical protein